MTKRKRPLSHTWSVVLTRLSGYEDGVKEQDLIELLGDTYAERDAVKGALSQMFFNDMKYYERHPDDRTKIRITEAGRKALIEGD